MFEILALGWAEILSVLVIFAITSGLMLEIYSIFTPSNPSLWYSALVILPIAGILTGIIQVITPWSSFLSASLLGVYEGQGYLLWAGLSVLLVVLLVDMVYSWGRDWFSDLGTGNWNMTGNAVLSVCQVGFVILLLVGPGLLAESMEPMETESDSIIPYEEVIISSSENLVYSPYLDMNESNQGYFSAGSGIRTGSHSLYSGDAEDPTSEVYDAVNTTDEFIYLSSRMDFYLYFYLSWDEIHTDNANLIYVVLDPGTTWTINYCSAYFMNGDGNSIDTVSIFSSSGSLEPGETYVHELSESDLSNLDTFETSYYPHLEPMIFFSITMGETVNSFSSDIQISPGYYQETTTTYNNQTVTSYKPFIQSISNPFLVYQWCFGVGGILLMIGSPVLLPWIRISKWLKKAMGL